MYTKIFILCTIICRVENNGSNMAAIVDVFSSFYFKFEFVYGWMVMLMLMLMMTRQLHFLESCLCLLTDVDSCRLHIFGNKMRVSWMKALCCCVAHVHTRWLIVGGENCHLGGKIFYFFYSKFFISLISISISVYFNHFNFHTNKTFNCK